MNMKQILRMKKADSYLTWDIRTLNAVGKLVELAQRVDRDKGAVYGQLGSTVNNISKKDTSIVQGGFNVKIGRDAHRNWPETTGRFGISYSNERGLRLWEFARMNMTIVITRYYHKGSREVTWIAPDGLTKTQIDFILTGRICGSSINWHKNRSRHWVRP